MRTFSLVFAAIFLFVAPGAGWAENRVALVIGNSSYRHVAALKNPTNDASDVSVALESLGFDVILGIDQSRQEMLDRVAEFEDRGADAEVALLFFAGHGFQVDGRNFLIPVDSRIARRGDISDQTIALDEILERMESFRGLKLVFLDACRDNPFEDRSDGIGDGLARVGSAADFLFAYATQPDNVAYDGTGRNSFFTEALLSHIHFPDQDVSDLMINVRKDVLAATGGKQIPWENSSLTRQFQFDSSPAIASDETILWQIAVATEDPSLMNFYMRKYPDGAHVDAVMSYLSDGSGVPGGSGVTRNTQPGISQDTEEIFWRLAQRSRARPLLEQYIERFPDGSYAEEASRLVATLPQADDASMGALCERLATHPRDRTAKTSGVPFARLQENAIAAIQACSAAASESPDLPHYLALLARATAATGDLDRAVTLYRQATERGDLRAMVSLAFLYETGTGVDQDPARALALYQQAAAGGSHDAMINLAVSLFEGDGITQDPDQAIDLLQRAASEGSAKATYNLGVLGQDGLVGTPGDALRNFLWAARYGEYLGYRSAAIMLDEGRGVPPDQEWAADLLLRGVASDAGELLGELTGRPGDWSQETIAWLQRRLGEAGHYSAEIDGLSGPAFDAALTLWRNGGFSPAVLRH
ncbi:MAG: caspase family protein [Pseudomonadota bacterium]